MNNCLHSVLQAASNTYTSMNLSRINHSPNQSFRYNPCSWLRTNPTQTTSLSISPWHFHQKTPLIWSFCFEDYLFPPTCYITTSRLLVWQDTTSYHFPSTSPWRLYVSPRMTPNSRFSPFARSYLGRPCAVR